MAFPNDIYLYPPDPADGLNDIRLRDNTAISAGTPVSVTPGIAVSAWVIGAVAIVLGAISVTPSTATSQWVGVSPNVVEGPNSGNPAVAVQSWTVPTVQTSEGGITAVPAPAIRTWTVPSITPSIGGLVAAPTVATSQWVTLSPNVLEGPDQASPAVAVQTWVVLDPTASVPGVPQSATPGVAITTWVIPTPFAGELVTGPIVVGKLSHGPRFRWVGPPQYAFPNAARSRWYALNPDTELGDVERTLDPATSDWVVMAPSIETAPDPDEELLILLLAEAP